MPRPRLNRTDVIRALSLAAVGLGVFAPAAASSHGRAGASDRWDVAPTPTAVVGYRTRADLARVLRLHPGVVLRTIPQLGVAEVLPRAPARNFATAAGRLDGAWNQDTGYGLIDAAAAVQAAQRLVATRAVTAPAAAGLTLTASAVQGTAPLDLGMQASLTSAGRPATGRTIALEAYDGGAWRASGTTGKTNASGKTAWQFTLAAGTYRVRARFAGDKTLRAAVSNTVAVTVD